MRGSYLYGKETEWEGRAEKRKKRKKGEKRMAGKGRGEVASWLWGMGVLGMHWG